MGERHDPRDVRDLSLSGALLQIAQEGRLPVVGRHGRRTLAVAAAMTAAGLVLMLAAAVMVLLMMLGAV